MKILCVLQKTNYFCLVPEVLWNDEIKQKLEKIPWGTTETN